MEYIKRKTEYLGEYSIEKEEIFRGEVKEIIELLNSMAKESDEEKLIIHCGNGETVTLDGDE
ncbi:hypothetical protein SAMN05446037_100277 [Anaerovirgula multivorans]|uniref:Uncharacterized protein n=1 Tax=Anaerovirgula multivorans TaxID=312168 RepID=A0A239AJU1_9FIRM|nr:hypothetical protein [Anaerovirgula multivorans]SNR95651.1 hypothetical protein SAMN05446037_100277 [Anaerovirgula multivorans]